MRKFRNTILCAAALLLVAALCASCGGAGFSEKDIELKHNDLPLRCGDAIADVVAALGEPDDYSEAISCAYDGLDKIYTYGQTEIYTYPDGEKDFILEVSVNGGTAVTAAGIGIGASLDEITAAYGDGYLTEGVTIVYEGAEHRLFFVMENGSAVSFGIAANTADEA